MRALELRREGLTYQVIAERLGRRSGTWAQAAVRRALALAITETADEVREIEIQRLESYIPHAMKVLNGRHLVVSQGRVVEDPQTGEPLLDPMPALNAVDRLLKISEAVRELRGLNAPKRSVQEIITVDAVQAEILRVRAELAAATAARELPPGSADGAADHAR